MYSLSETTGEAIVNGLCVTMDVCASALLVVCASALLVVCASALLVVCASALLVVCVSALLVVHQCIASCMCLHC